MPFELRKRYNFTTLAPAILGASYKNMKVVSLISQSEAVKYSDVVTKHETLKQTIAGLPASTVNMTFILFEDSNGDKVVFADEYIDQLTITEITTITLQINVYDADPTMTAIIQARLRELGVVNFTVAEI